MVKYRNVHQRVGLGGSQAALETVTVLGAEQKAGIARRDDRGPCQRGGAFNVPTRSRFIAFNEISHDRFVGMWQQESG